MHKIVQLRPLTIKETPFARALKPFEDADLVDRLYDDIDRFEFVIDITKDTSVDSEYFSHILLETHRDMTPAELYEHIKETDETVPPLFIVYEQNGHYRNVLGVKTYRQIQRFVHTMHSKGVINGRALIKGPNEQTY